MYHIQLVVISVMFGQILMYSLDYYDCSRPKITAKYSAQHTCAPTKIDKANNTKQFELLQRIEYQETEGFSCQLEKSSFTMYCGSFSHNKFEKVPQIQVGQNVEPAMCRSWYRNKKFKAADGTLFDLKVPGITYIENVDVGELVAKSNGYCKGLSLKVDGNVLENTIVLSQYKITIQKQKYKMKLGSKVEVTSNHLLLPRECRSKQGSCTVAQATYIWLPTLPRCSLEKLATLHATQENSFIIDKHQKLVIKLLSIVPAPSGCRNIPIYQTPLKNIFIAESTDYHWPQFSTSEIYIPAMVRSMSEYVLYESEKNVQKMFRSSQENLCKAQNEVNTPRYLHIRDNIFATRRADVIYTFSCTKEVGTLVDTKRCYADLTLKGHGKSGSELVYVDAETRIRRQSSSPASCDRAFQMEVKTREGPYVKVNPGIVKTVTPPQEPIEAISEFKHEQIATLAGDTGLYSNDEIEIHATHIMEEEYAQALSQTIAYGVLVHGGQIQDDNQYGYDLSRLSPLQVVNELDLLKKLDHFITKFGGYLSLIVIIMEGFKLCTSLAMVAYSLAMEGVLGAKAILLGLCCNKYVSTQNRLERARRRRIRHAQSDDVELKDLRDREEQMEVD